MEELLEELGDNTKSFWRPTNVARLKEMPSPQAFFRDYVSTSTPVIISGAATEGTSMMQRSWDDLSSFAPPDLEVTVAFTPDGRGDAVIDVSSGERGQRKGAAASVDADDGLIFVKPEERRMSFASFVALMDADAKQQTASSADGGESLAHDEGVPYLSHQNDSLRKEFPGLMEADIEPVLELAREAFGNEPDAVNLWIGDDRSVSALHKDHYENMYCVVRGEKRFTLLPPSDVLFLYEREFPQGTYRRKSDARGLEVEVEEGKVDWIPVDPECPDMDKYPLYRHASPVHCRVLPGEILYLPALWYHRVAQRGVTVAVNYWHDMRFDHKYVYYKLLQGLARNLLQNGSVLSGSNRERAEVTAQESDAPV